jgi:hypothetical protein
MFDKKRKVIMTKAEKDFLRKQYDIYAKGFNYPLSAPLPQSNDDKSKIIISLLGKGYLEYRLDSRTQLQISRNGINYFDRNWITKFFYFLKEWSGIISIAAIIISFTREIMKKLLIIFSILLAACVQPKKYFRVDAETDNATFRLNSPVAVIPRNNNITSRNAVLQIEDALNYIGIKTTRNNNTTLELYFSFASETKTEEEKVPIKQTSYIPVSSNTSANTFGGIDGTSSYYGGNSIYHSGNLSTNTNATTNINYKKEENVIGYDTRKVERTYHRMNISIENKNFGIVGNYTIHDNWKEIEEYLPWILARIFGANGSISVVCEKNKTQDGFIEIVCN